MATINMSSTHSFPHLCLFSSLPQNTPALSLNSQVKTKPYLLLRSISLKPYNTCTNNKPRTSLVASAVKNLDETDPVVLPQEIEGTAAEVPSGTGVYAIYDNNDELGLSRNNAASVSAHRNSIPELAYNLKGVPHLKDVSTKLSYQRIEPFDTRCVPGLFVEVCEHLRNRQDAMEKLKKIGFDKLVEVTCPRIPRDFCKELMLAFEPESMKIKIRGRTLQMSPKDVHELLGLPCGGKQINIDTFNKKDKVFKDYKRIYRRLKYTEIGAWLKKINVNDENFEFLFVLFTLGAFLCPSKGLCVNDHLLMVTLSTINEVTTYDWSSYVLNQLCDSIQDYQIQLRDGNFKRKNGNVKGCLYLLMIFCLQNFPLGEYVAPSSKDALAYWDFDKVRVRLNLEKNHTEGFLCVQRPTTKVIQESDFIHPEIRRTYSRLIPMVDSELVSLKSKLLGENKNDMEGRLNIEGRVYVQRPTRKMMIHESDFIHPEIRRTYSKLTSMMDSEFTSLKSKLLGGNKNDMEGDEHANQSGEEDEERDEDANQSEEEDKEVDERGSDLEGKV